MKYVLMGFFIATLPIGALADTAFASTISIQNETPRAVYLNEDDNLSKATVNLYCRIKIGNKDVSSTGTGVTIDSRGVILTNAHVAQYFLLNGQDSKLKANCSVRTGSPAKETYSAEVLYISNNWLTSNTTKSKDKSIKSTGENDFALLYITNAKAGSLPAIYPALSLGTAERIEKGAEVKVAGYPSGDLNFKEIRNKLSILSATTTITNLQAFHASTTDSISLSRTKLASSGVSGGPVIKSNKVIGIVAMRSTSKSDEGASLRALTISYIDRAVTNETGLSLLTLLNGDLAKRTAETRASISTKALSAIEKPLRVLR